MFSLGLLPSIMMPGEAERQSVFLPFLEGGRWHGEVLLYDHARRPFAFTEAPLKLKGK